VSALFVIGYSGRVGQALLRRLVGLGRPGLRGVANTRGAWYFPRPLSARELDEAVAEAEPQRLDTVLERLRHEAPDTVVLDLSASAEVVRCYPRLLGRGVGLVAANKLGFSGSQAEFDLLHQLAQASGAGLRYETTAGAALPILATLARHRAVGDRLVALDASLSGTLAYVLERIADGAPFSRALLEAQQAGYTEPDPNVDLSGQDVLRKLLILLRQAGIAVEPRDVRHRPLVEVRWRGPDRALDALWAERAEAARASGERWVYVAGYRHDQVCVEPRLLPAAHPLAQSRGTDNVIVVRTELYRDPPLVIRGPGAGPDLTAAGVLQDALELLERQGDRWCRPAPLRAVG
jgi:aspartokinase/homoserine dehydrogenase 1